MLALEKSCPLSGFCQKAAGVRSLTITLLRSCAVEISFGRHRSRSIFVSPPDHVWKTVSVWIAEEDAQLKTQNHTDDKQYKKNRADPRLLNHHLAEFEDSFKLSVKNHRHIRKQEALNLIDLCAQGLGKPQRMDIRLECWLQTCLEKLIEDDKFAPNAAAEAFYLRPGKGRTYEGAEVKIACAVQTRLNQGEQYEDALNNVDAPRMGSKNVGRIYTEHKLFAKALIAEQHLPSLTSAQIHEAKLEFLSGKEPCGDNEITKTTKKEASEIMEKIEQIFGEGKKQDKV